MTEERSQGYRPLLRLAAIATVLTVVLHFAWEMAQAAAFAPFAGSFSSGTVRCFRAALGDLLIGGSAYVGAAVMFRRLSWPVRPGWVAPAAIWIALGLTVTVLFERWALSQGRWAYGSAMPVLFGVGLLPVLQWLVVPLVTLLLVRWRASEWVSHG